MRAKSHIRKKWETNQIARERNALKGRQLRGNEKLESKSGPKSCFVGILPTSPILSPPSSKKRARTFNSSVQNNDEDSVEKLVLAVP